MRPGRTSLRRCEPERSDLVGFLRKGAERLAHFDDLDAAQDGDRTELMPIQPLRQPAENRLCRIRGYPFDDELTPRDAKGDLRPVGQQTGRAGYNGRSRRLQRRMAVRIHRVLVKSDRELDQKLAERARESDLIRT
jgi:hypothetical protein